MKILIIGGGGITQQLLNNLDLRLHEILIVDKDQQRCSEISEKYDVLIINKDATDPSIYSKDIDMTTVDVLLALTDKEEVNLFVSLIAKSYNVPFRVIRVKDADVADLVKKLDLGIPFIIPSIISNMIMHFLSTVKQAVPVTSFDNKTLYWITLLSIDKAVGRRIDELELPNDVKILLIFDGYQLRTPSPDEVLSSGWQLLILSEQTSAGELTELLKG